MAEEFRLGKLSFPLSTQIKAVAEKIKEIPDLIEIRKSYKAYVFDSLIYMIMFSYNQESAISFVKKNINVNGANQSLGTLTGDRNQSTLLTDDLKKSGINSESSLDDLKKYIDRSRMITDTAKKELLRFITGSAVKEGISDMTPNSQSYEDIITDHIKNGGIRQIILTGAPGTGKNYTAKKAAKTLIGEDQAEGRIELVQFHPSYDYTDFVEGIRPVTGQDGKMKFKKLDGTFKAFCRKVAENNEVSTDEKKKLYFFIIDEINRADLSKVFGELMYCLEKDKRGTKGRVQTQYQNLASFHRNGDPIENDCFTDGFYIPENIVVIGTMNDIDRSVESMDFALRRRFEWLEFVVDPNSLTEAFNGGILCGGNENHKDAVIASIVALNKVIETKGSKFGLNRQYYISHGHFTDLPKQENRDALLEYVWKYRLENTIREYLRGENENSIEEFIGSCREAFLKSSVGAADDISEENGNDGSEQ